MGNAAMSAAGMLKERLGRSKGSHACAAAQQDTEAGKEGLGRTSRVGSGGERTPNKQRGRAHGQWEVSRCEGWSGKQSNRQGEAQSRGGRG